MNNNTNNVKDENKFVNIKTYNKDNFERYKKYSDIHSDMSIDEVVKNVNINIDYNFYETDFKSINNYTPLVLVNKHYNLGNDYVPSDLENLGYPYAINSDIKGNKEAYQHFKDLYNDASSVGLTIKIISAYRSYEYQKKLYEGYLKSDPVEIVDTYSARPGHSEHQTGYAFDLYNVLKSYTDFGSTKEYEWLKINAHLYGFIIRYTKDNTNITGYKDEPWHIRYVGIENAKYIYENGITLEEYLLNK